MVQKPGTLALKAAPLTNGEASSSAAVTARSAASSRSVRRRGAAYPQIATPVHAASTPMQAASAAGCEKLSAW